MARWSAAAVVVLVAACGRTAPMDHSARRARADAVTIGGETSLDPPATKRGANKVAAAFGAGVHVLVSEGIANRFPAGGTESVDNPGILVGPRDASYVVSFDGTRFLTAWSSAAGVSARTIEPSGALGPVLSLASVSPSVDAMPPTGVIVAGQSGLHLVAWGQYSPSRNLEFRVARVKSDGSVLDPGGVTIATDKGYAPQAVLATGSGFLVGWGVGGYDLFFVAVDAAGVVSPITTLAGVTPDVFRLSRSSGQNLLAWSKRVGGTNYLHVARISSSGALVDTPRVSTFGVDRDLELTADGTGWLAVFDRYEYPTFPFSGDRYGIHIDAAGNIVETEPFKIVSATAPSGVLSSLTSDPNDHLLTTTSAAGLVGHRINKTTGVVSGPYTAFYVHNRQTEVRAVAGASGTSLVAWNDDRLSGPGVYATRVGSSGAALGVATRLSTAPRSAKDSPSLAYGKGKWFAATINASGVSEVIPVRDDGTVEALVTVTGGVPQHQRIVHDGTRPVLVRSIGGKLYFDTLDDTGNSVRSSGPVVTRVSYVGPGVTEVVFEAAAGEGRVFAAVESESTAEIVTYDALTGAASPATTVLTGAGQVLIGGAAVTASRFYVAHSRSTSPAGAFLLPIAFDRTPGTPVLVREFGYIGPIAPDGSGLTTLWNPPSPLAGSGLPPPDVMLQRFAGSGPSLHPAATLVPGAGNATFTAYSLAAIAPRKVLFATTVEGRAVARAITFGSDIGSACTTSAECETGFCVDGYCCNAACSGQCEACDVAGRPGLCSAIDGVPHGTRAACAGKNPYTECGVQCIGAANRTACTYPPTSVKCSKDACEMATETHASTCDGAGSCSDVPKSCGGFACAGTTCPGTCTTKVDCVAGYTCAGGACVPVFGAGKPCAGSTDCTSGLFCTDGVCCARETCGPTGTCAGPASPGTCATKNGAACANSSECASSFCTDGICCESACLGQCAACDVKGSEGKCVPVLGAPHGARAACDVDGASPCRSSACDGSDSTKCAGFVGLEVVCKPASCSEASQTQPSKCDGTGACKPGATSSCDGYTCDGDACRSSCSGNADCVTGYHCEGSACRPDPAACDGDSVSVQRGSRSECTPYRCDAVTGACRERCTSESECLEGFSCNSAGACVATPDEPASEGCVVSRRRSSMEMSVLALFSLGALGLVSRRRSAST